MDKDMLKRIFMINSFLLIYPDADWFETLEEVREEAAKINDDKCLKPVFCFLDIADRMKVLNLSELYVNTFDFSGSSSLYLTYHRCKDTSLRGKALHGVKQRYSESGFEPISGELPDFLPVLLEFAALSGEKKVVTEYSDVLKEIYMSLNREKNPYLHIIKSILLAVEEELFEEPAKLSESGGVKA